MIEHSHKRVIKVIRIAEMHSPALENTLSKLLNEGWALLAMTDVHLVLLRWEREEDDAEGA